MTCIYNTKARDRSALEAFAFATDEMCAGGTKKICLDTGRGLAPYLRRYRPWSCAYRDTLSRSLTVLSGSLRIVKYLLSAFSA